MIFVTVGSMFAFDRLVRAIDEQVATGLIRDSVFAQIGAGAYQPTALPFERFVEKVRFEELLASADCIVSHAGIGSIATALEHGKPIVVLPRQRRYGEHVNDHQIATARRYAELGHVLVAFDERQIPAALEQVADFRPRPRRVNVAGIAVRIAGFLRDAQAQARSR